MEENYNFFPSWMVITSKQKDFPGGVVIKNTCNGGDACSVLGGITKIPHA